MAQRRIRAYGSVAAITAVITIGLAAAGCGGEPELYGEPISDREVTPIADVLAAPADFEGRTVKLRGEIALECSTGCWFRLADGEAVIHVDIKPAGLAIPQYVGRTVTTEGVVSTIDRQTMIVGKGVEVH